MKKHKDLIDKFYSNQEIYRIKYFLPSGIKFVNLFIIKFNSATIKYVFTIIIIQGYVIKAIIFNFLYFLL